MPRGTTSMIQEYSAHSILSSEFFDVPRLLYTTPSKCKEQSYMLCLALLTCTTVDIKKKSSRSKRCDVSNARKSRKKLLTTLATFHCILKYYNALVLSPKKHPFVLYVPSFYLDILCSKYIDSFGGNGIFLSCKIYIFHTYFLPLKLAF